MNFLNIVWHAGSIGRGKQSLLVKVFGRKINKQSKKYLPDAMFLFLILSKAGMCGGGWGAATDPKQTAKAENENSSETFHCMGVIPTSIFGSLCF